MVVASPMLVTENLLGERLEDIDLIDSKSDSQFDADAINGHGSPPT